MNKDWKVWILVSSVAALLVAAVIAGDERDHLTKQPDGSYR